MLLQAAIWILTGLIKPKPLVNDATTHTWWMQPQETSSNIKTSNRFQALSTLIEEADSGEKICEESETAWNKTYDKVLERKLPNYATQGNQLKP